jgi:hypothetical protein
MVLSSLTRCFREEARHGSRTVLNGVGAEFCVTSCDLGVLVEEAAEPVSSDDLDVGVDRIGKCPQWAGLVQGMVRAMGVEVGLVLSEDLGLEHLIESRVRVSCSHYSVLMLIGPLVRRPAAQAPGVAIQIQPRSPDPSRMLRDGAGLDAPDT